MAKKKEISEKSACLRCEWFDEKFGECASFRDGIPEEYLSGEKVHDKDDERQHIHGEAFIFREKPQLPIY